MLSLLSYFLLRKDVIHHYFATAEVYLPILPSDVHLLNSKIALISLNTLWPVFQHSLIIKPHWCISKKKREGSQAAWSFRLSLARKSQQKKNRTTFSGHCGWSGGWCSGEGKNNAGKRLRRTRQDIDERRDAGHSCDTGNPHNLYE